MSLRLFTSVVFLIVLAGAAGAAWADSFESPSAIRAAVQAAAERQMAPAKDQTFEIDIGEIDSRIHLAACPALVVDIPPANTSLLSARISCRQPFWTLYVPVQVRAWGLAVVASTNLAPGKTLTAADLTMARLDVLATNGAYLTDPRQAEGMILRANVRSGAPILTPLLELPVLVHRGDTVVLTLLDSAMTIRTSVIAMEDGRAGDRILVENPDSKKTVRAAVTDSGAVIIRLDQARENY
jgi:flagella basal body P-ring formation protein FlgA